MRSPATIRLNRRQLLRLSASAAVAATLAACSTAPPLRPTPGATAPDITPESTHPPTPLPPIATTTDLIPPSVAAWLRNYGVPFAGVDGLSDFTDLQPLVQMVGDAPLVGLGEATHGTHEFAAMKHRLARFLITEMGFTTFALEAGLPECDGIDTYVNGGSGDPVTLLRGLGIWPWRIEEMRDLIDWIRDYNSRLSAAARVHFRGFDMQTIDTAQEHVLALLREVDPDAAAQADARYRLPTVGYPGQESMTILLHASPAVQAEYLDAVRSVFDDLTAARVRYEAIAPPERVAVAVQNARVVIQGVDFIAAYARKQYGVRDAYMAENIGWLLDQAGTNGKMILWAHNEHIGATPAATDVPDAVTKSMGTWLRERYNDRYRPIGQTFYAGECNAIEGTLTEVTVPPPPNDSYEAALRQTTQPRLLLDLRNTQPSDIVRQWLSNPHLLHAIGASYDEADPDRYYGSVRLEEKFDVLIYIERSTPSHLLPAI